MKNTKLIVLGIAMLGVMLASAQESDETSAKMRALRQDAFHSAEIGVMVNEQGARFAAAADYLRLALVLGLGMLMGRMSAISNRELTELRLILTKFVNRSPVTANEIKGLDTCRQEETKN